MQNQNVKNIANESMSNKERMKAIKVSLDTLKYNAKIERDLGDEVAEALVDIPSSPNYENNNPVNENISPEDLEKMRELAKGGEFIVIKGFIDRTKELFEKFPKSKTESNVTYITRLENFYDEGALEFREIAREIANCIKMFIFANTIDENIAKGRLSEEIGTRIKHHYAIIGQYTQKGIETILDNVNYTDYQETLNAVETKELNKISSTVSKQLSDIINLNGEDYLELLTSIYAKVKQEQQEELDNQSKSEMIAMQIMSILSTLGVSADWRKNPVGRKVISKYWHKSKTKIPRKLQLTDLFELTMAIAIELDKDSKSIIDWCKENSIPKHAVKSLILSEEDFGQSDQITDELKSEIEQEQQSIKDYIDTIMSKSI